jgi:hypothetical protein
MYVLLKPKVLSSTSRVDAAPGQSRFLPVAIEIIAAVPDPEIGPLVRLGYAESLLSVFPGYHSEIEWHKDGVKGIW